MIPADLAARLRMLTEASFFNNEPQVPGLARAREIQGQLPELLPGQRFTATLQRALPDGTFQAVVAGRSYTLSLAHGASVGDTLELIVTQTSPRAVFAQRAAPESGQGSPSPGASQPTLSPTGRLISFLLTGQPVSSPTPLAGGQPLLPAPPANGAVLAPLLRQALAQSGLFYESHQAQWLAGKTGMGLLAAEPQGQQPPADKALGAPGSPSPFAQGAAAASGRASPSAAGAEAAAVGAAGASAGDVAETAELQGAGQAKLPAVPERLLPIVHQQLDALATHQLVLQTQAWPGQLVQWEIEDPYGGHDDDSGGEGGEEEPERSWNSTLRLSLPRLGGVEAQLQLTPAGVAVRLFADEADALIALGAGHDALEAALGAADVPLTGFIVEARHDDER